MAGLRVERYDGESGLVLVFHEIGVDDRNALALLPVVEAPDAGEAIGGVAISEILDRVDAA